ncbi:Zinc finger protein 408 [Camponotus floridanus]|uniref:Zinc finger protein 408 n=2 Tax=Camponotus floridanus TaxID=104421 RepID=E2AS57_CAMFO|nr:Zinc finger protein 408 [Camponotus floridanus]
MAYASLPKLVPINSSNMCPNNMTQITLSEMLQSDPVKRLFNQPNIIIKTIPLSSVSSELDKDIFGDKKNGMNATTLKPSAISIVPVMIPDEERDDANLLPSKIEDKKSEIALLPIKKKLCGHNEPCENIVCDVMVQQYVDNDRVSPMLAVNIEEEEINAPVGKHCKNRYCDALSIDHNRCRQASIKLYRCDKCRVCDICGITLEGWRSRIHHRNCARKNEYRHNNVDRADLLKERMRERELQILEVTKMKRNDYSDPAKAMETLRKNEEIIIIPKTTPSQQPIITITSVPTTQSVGSNVSNAQPIKINSQANNFANIFGNLPFTISPQNTLRPIESKAQPINQVGFPNLQQKSYVVTPTSTPTSIPASVATSVSTSVPSSQNQYVLATCSSQTTAIQPLTISNWVVSPSHVITTTPIQAKPFLTPIRVVPITNLITAPSLLHRTQGIPKFCIMAENVVTTPVTVPNPSPLQPAAATVTNAVTTVNTVTTATAVTTSNTITTTQQKDASKVPIQHYSIQKLHKGQKVLKKKKTFFCDYCSKHFSTDWYFKMHVAKHKGVKLFFCNLCDESFSNKYDMKKHMTKQHNGQKEIFTQRSKEFACDKCDYVCKSFAFFKNHVKTHATLNSDKADAKLKKEKLKLSEKKINHTSVNDSNKRDTKDINCQDTSDNLNKDKVVSVIDTTTQDNIKSSVFQTVTIKNEDDTDSMNNENTSAKMNGFTFVSIEESLDPKNYKQESIIMS